jgi:hypothetical protein
VIKEGVLQVLCAVCRHCFFLALSFFLLRRLRPSFENPGSSSGCRPS